MRAAMLHMLHARFCRSVERLIDELKHLPGIGQKTASAWRFHLLRAGRGCLALADAIRDAKEKIRRALSAVTRI